MKTVLLLRHGKSDWSQDGAHDFHRPLAKRGQRAARLMGRQLARMQMVPDIALTSPAVRARTTLELAMEAGDWHCPVEISDPLYGEGEYAVLRELRRQEDGIASVLLVGHEPTWSDAVQLLVGGGRHRVPTAALVGMEFPVEAWADVRPGGGQLVFLLPPRLIGSE